MKFGRAIEHDGVLAAAIVDVSHPVPDIQRYDANHVLVTYPPTKTNPEGVQHIVPSGPMYTDEQMAQFDRKRAIQEGMPARLRGFSLEQLTRLDDFVTVLQQENER